MAGPNVITRSRAQTTFPLFPRLPEELRRMVWREAMPGYGIYPVFCEGRRGGGGQVELSLRPVPRGRWEAAFAERVCGARALLAACRESRAEVGLCYPDTLPTAGGAAAGGELRVHAARDVVLVLQSDEVRCGLLFEEMDFGGVTFAGGWHRRLQRVALQIDGLAGLAGGGLVWEHTLLLHGYMEVVRGRWLGNMTALAKSFPALRQLVLARDLGCGVPSNLRAGEGERLREIWSACHHSGRLPSSHVDIRDEPLAVHDTISRQDRRFVSYLGKCLRKAGGEEEEEEEESKTSSTQGASTSGQEPCRIEIQTMWNAEPEWREYLRPMSF